MQVAVKSPLDDDSNDRIEAELAFAAALPDHDNILRCIGQMVRGSKGRLDMVLEKADSSLETHIEYVTPLPSCPSADTLSHASDMNRILQLGRLVQGSHVFCTMQCILHAGLFLVTSRYRIVVVWTLTLPCLAFPCSSLTRLGSELESVGFC